MKSSYIYVDYTLNNIPQILYIKLTGLTKSRGRSTTVPPVAWSFNWLGSRNLPYDSRISNNQLYVTAIYTYTVLKM